MPAKHKSRKSSKGARAPRETVLQKLMRAKLNHTTVAFRDGRVLDGTVVFNEIKGTGRLINADKEFSVDFTLEDVRDVRL